MFLRYGKEAGKIFNFIFHSVETFFGIWIFMICIIMILYYYDTDYYDTISAFTHKVLKTE